MEQENDGKLILKHKFKIEKKEPYGGLLILH
jgi:hypothetical protein